VEGIPHVSDYSAAGATTTGTGSTDGSSSSPGSTLTAEIDRVMSELSPIGGGEKQIRERAQILALAIGAATQQKDLAAREALLDELCELGEAGAGLMLAVEHLTTVRLDGLPLGWLKPDVVIGPALTYAPVHGTEAEKDQYVAWLEIITHIWTGKAAGLPARYTHGMSQFANSSRDDIRAMILIMAQDVADRIERFVGWNGDGWGALDDYRLAHPLPHGRLAP